jgi:hypothetical protein
MTNITGPMKAADLFVEALVNENISHIFALPGFSSRWSLTNFLLWRTLQIHAVMDLDNRALRNFYIVEVSTDENIFCICRRRKP